MLYDRWRQIAHAWPHQTALRDLASGRAWTFAELEKEAQSGAPEGPVVFPQGQGATFVLEVLKAWRHGRVVCPLETGQCRPSIPGSLPHGAAHLKTTSATTGTPRLVVFTADQLMADAANIIATMGLRADWPNLGVISLAHSYGFSNLVLPLLLHGVPLILVGTAFPEAIRQSAARFSAVTIPAVPALWQSWHDAGAIPDNVKVAISAGAPLSLKLEREVFATQGLKIHNFYGSTECGGIGYDASPAPRQDAACVGAAMAGVNITVGEYGCLEVRGAAVGLTYWPEPGSRLEAGVFRTSDVGEVLAGQLYLRGRASDQINVAGRKVLPETIEAILLQHREVRACLVFGVDSADSQRGETIVGCIAGRGTALESVRQFAMSYLPAWQVPREWWFVDALETNERGKRSRAEWRKRYLEQAVRK
jgi:acyl-CoA synthetase (AMP-forming)/AMP-acid ligase II